jgi:hypothetical protein
MMVLVIRARGMTRQMPVSRVVALSVETMRPFSLPALGCLSSSLLIAAAIFVALGAFQSVRAGVTAFNPGDAAHLAEDASHFASEADPGHYAQWTEWWYFNFHDPDVESGWDGFVVFHTQGDLRSGGGAHFVQVAVDIWNGGDVRWRQSYPLLGQDLSGYDSSASQCDVSIEVAESHTCTAAYDAVSDEYAISVSNPSGLSIDLAYDRISRGFLTDLQGFP